MAAAPDPSDIIWSNSHVPLHEIAARKTVSRVVLAIVALCWSAIVASIFAVANLSFLSTAFPAIRRYSSNRLYSLANDYLAIGALLGIMTLLPLCFDRIARYCEREKLESAVQQAVMTRSFWFHLVNLFVTVGIGSLLSSVHEVLDDPRSLLAILGGSLPAVSIYFAKFVVVSALTSVPLEMLQLGALLTYLLGGCDSSDRQTLQFILQYSVHERQITFFWLF